MPSFHVQIPHELSQTVALERLKPFVEQMQRQFAEKLSQVSGKWNGPTLEFSLLIAGFRITGTLVTEDKMVRVEGRVPFLVAPFARKIEQEIANELFQLLSAIPCTISENETQS